MRGWGDSQVRGPGDCQDPSIPKSLCLRDSLPLKSSYDSALPDVCPYIRSSGLPGATDRDFWDNGEGKDIEICFSSL